VIFFRNIVTLVAVLVFTVGSTGTPQLIHYCSDVPQTVACDPVDCCDDTEEAESDDCCSDEVTIQNINEPGTLSPVVVLPAPAQLDADPYGYNGGHTADVTACHGIDPLPGSLQEFRRAALEESLRGSLAVHLAHLQIYLI